MTDKTYKIVSNDPYLIVRKGGVVVGKQCGFFIGHQDVEPEFHGDCWEACRGELTSYGYSRQDDPIKAVFFDMDGTFLTPNRELLLLAGRGKQKFREFYSRMYTHGTREFVNLALADDIKIAINSADTGELPKMLATRLCLTDWHGSSEHHNAFRGKLDYMMEMCKKWNLSRNNVAAIGDDTSDALVIRYAGCGVAFGKYYKEDWIGANALNMSGSHMFLVPLLLNARTLEGSGYDQKLSI